MNHTQVTIDDGDAQQIARRVIRVIKKGRWLIAFGSLITVVLTTIGLTFIPSKYRSDATILIAEQEIAPSLVAPLSTVPAAQRLQAMEQEILSQSRLLEIIDKFGLFSDQRSSSPESAVNSMRAAIDIAPIDAKQDQFTAFSISFTAATPQLAQDVTKTLCSVFIERNSEKQANRVKSTSDFIQSQMAEKRGRLAAIEQRVQGFKSEHAGELPEDRAMNQERLRDARSQVETTAANLARAKGQRVIWQQALTGDLENRLNHLKADRDALLKNYTPQHRDVIAKDELIAQFEAALQAVKTGAPLPASLVAASDAGVSQLQGELQANALEIETLTNEQARQTAKIAEYESRLNATAALEQQLAGMVRESDELSADVAETLKTEQKTGMSVDAERHQEGGQFKQLDPPSLPERPSSPARLKISLASAFLGAVLGLVIAFLWDLRNSAYHSEDELRERFAPPLLLSVPALLTSQEQRTHSWTVGLETIAGSLVTVAILAVEIYVYRHP